MIHFPDNATDTSLFCLSVQTTGGHAFKLALWLISHGLEGVDGRIVHTQHEKPMAVEIDPQCEQLTPLLRHFDPDTGYPVPPLHIRAAIGVNCPSKALYPPESIWRLNDIPRVGEVKWEANLQRLR